MAENCKDEGPMDWKLGRSKGARNTKNIDILVKDYKKTLQIFFSLVKGQELTENEIGYSI